MDSTLSLESAFLPCFYTKDLHTMAKAYRALDTARAMGLIKRPVDLHTGRLDGLDVTILGMGFEDALSIINSSKHIKSELGIGYPYVYRINGNPKQPSHQIMMYGGTKEMDVIKSVKVASHNTSPMSGDYVKVSPTNFLTFIKP